jgi:FkbM family methyltransferase
MNKAAREAQLLTLGVAFEYVTNWAVAIDGGANIGDWTGAMARRFKTVFAFEPSALLSMGLRARFAGLSNVRISEAALWRTSANVTVKSDDDHPKKHRSQYVEEGGTVPATSIDALGLKSCGLIKLDVEGAEMLVLEGAADTIKRFGPVIVCELSGHAERYGYGAREPGHFLKGFGYQQVARRKPDCIYARSAT